MRKPFIALFTVALLVSGFTTLPAFAGFGFEDPQLCVNGALLSVVPGAATDVYVSVPAYAYVDFQVAGCGGDPSLPVVAASNVSYSDKDKIAVSVKAADGTSVVFAYNGSVQTKLAALGLARAKFPLK